ncbi:MAG: alanine--tRNA ligase-related protein [bacterium]|nr:alanine--tRNA ligase-related protein [bacterium]
MDIHEIRAKYLEFFERRGHALIPSAPIIPENDPTTLFTGSGMQPLIPYLLGKKHPVGDRLVNSQTCFRAMDIDEVGDNRHTTFFEMLGNWSLGDYFKSEQLPWLFEFLTEEIGLDPKRLYVTAFIGDEKNGIPRDTESVAIWKWLFEKNGIDAKEVALGSEADGYRIGMQVGPNPADGQGRIFYYDASKNWWSRAGTPEEMPEGEPGGPDSEVFYDFQTPHDKKFGNECHPNCECGRFLEIGNSVFMQYIKQGNSFSLLPKQNVDFGGGLERIAAAKNSNPDVFTTDVFEKLIELLEFYSDGKSYDDSRYTGSFRIIADHMRAATFMIADGVKPSNTDRGYILRRLIRRAAQHAISLGCAQGQEKENELVRCATLVIEKYKGWYTKLGGEEMYETISREIWQEEKQFAHALEQGTREFEKMTTGTISGEQAFMLFTTYGFPLEMTLEMAQEKGKSVDVMAFKALMEKHKDTSRAGSGQKFKGGLADTSVATTRLHTAHHLLLKALQIVLGPQVKQRGSNITSERLRIDFSHGEKMKPEQIAEVVRIVNEKIKEALPVINSTLPKREAEKLGAQQEFGAKYPDMVSVYSVGPEGATKDNPQFEKTFSIEFCGGPHVENTGDLAGIRDPDGSRRKDVFKILKEEAVASGIRRIKAVLVRD